MNSAQRIRLMIYSSAAVILCVWLMLKSRQPQFEPDIVLSSSHYVIESRADKGVTSSALEKCELLLETYENYFNELFEETGLEKTRQAIIEKNKKILAESPAETGPKMKLRLFKNRYEFKNAGSMGPSWAEAYYLTPYCYQYIDQDTDNQWHWMMHEATHQLNYEYSGFRQKIWLEEGIATYFSTSLMENGEILLGELDPNTYPVWWLHNSKEYDSLDQAVEKGGIIRLKHVVTGKGGPFLNLAFNLYYIHWFSIVHFLNHHNNGQYRKAIPRLIIDGGSAESFIKHVGKFEKIEKEWYLYHKILCRSLN